MTEGNLPLIDSNVLIYAFDLDEIAKNLVAERLFEDIATGKIKIALSVQNLSEFYFNVTKKISSPVSTETAEDAVQSLISFSNVRILTIKPSSILSAIKISNNFNISYWDDLIAATMQENSLFTIITENEKDFSKIPWLKIVNPFK